MSIKFAIAWMRDNKMCNIWQALIKCILHVFIEKSDAKYPFHSLIRGGRVVSTTLPKLPIKWLSILETMSINGKTFKD